MIRAGGRTPGGTPLVILGLEYSNLWQLMDAKPMVIDTAQVGVLPAFTILVHAAETFDGLDRALREADIGFPDDGTIHDPSGWACFTAQRDDVTPMRLFVAGMTRPAVMTLLDGKAVGLAAHGFGTPGGPDPLVVILSAATNDDITDALARSGWLTDHTDVEDRCGPGHGWTPQALTATPDPSPEPPPAQG